MTSNVVAQTTNQILSILGLDIITTVLVILLVFSLTYLLLEVSQIFKTDNNDKEYKKINFLFATGVAFTIVSDPSIITKIQYFVPSATVALLVLFMFLLTLTFITSNRISENSLAKSMMALIVIIVLVYLGATAGLKSSVNAGEYENLMQGIAKIFTPDIVAILIILAIIVLLFYWLTSGGEESRRSPNTTNTNNTG